MTVAVNSLMTDKPVTLRFQMGLAGAGSGGPETPQKNPRNKDETRQKNQRTDDAYAGILTDATLVKVEGSHCCAVLSPACTCAEWRRYKCVCCGLKLKFLIPIFKLEISKYFYFRFPLSQIHSYKLEGK